MASAALVKLPVSTDNRNALHLAGSMAAFLPVKRQRLWGTDTFIL